MKVGDKVIANASSPWAATTNGWKGTITAIHNNNWVTARGLNYGKTGEGHYMVPAEIFEHKEDLFY